MGLEEMAYRGASFLVVIVNYYLGDKIKEDEMDWAHSMHAGDGK